MTISPRGPSTYILVLFESRTGNTAALAEAVASGVRSAGFAAKLLSVEQAKPDDLLDPAGIIVGSFTSYGILAGRLKSFFDDSAKLHGKLVGKVGGVFATSGGLGGGNETTVLSLLQILLVHGLVIQGSADSPHFGAVAIGTPDERALESGRLLGKRVAELTARLHQTAH